MKKITLAAIALASLAIIASCKKEKETSEVTLNASIEQHKSGSRTSLNPTDGAIYWMAGDKILVNNGTNSAIFSLASGQGTSNGNFRYSGSFDLGESNIAVYPSTATLNGNTANITLPAIQTLSSPGSFANGANPMLAVFSDEDLVFTSLCGGLGLSLTGDNVAITAIEIVSTDQEEKLNGTFECTLDEPALVAAMDNAGTNSVMLNCPTTLTADAQEFYVVLPVGVLANGLTMNVYSGGDEPIFSKSTENTDLVVELNTIKVLSTIEVTTTPATIPTYIGVEGGTLISGEMPEPNSSTIIDVTMNPNVIPGGTSILNVAAPDGVAINSILVGVEGQYGYYQVAPDPTGNIVLDVNQMIPLSEGDSFTIYVAIVDEDGNISQIWEGVIHLIVVGTGTLQVSLSFNNAKDIDLHLIEPNGTHIYYGHTWSSNGGHLDLDSNPSCSIDNVNNENITYDENAYVEPGVYTVYVDMWRNCNSSIATDFVVAVYYGGVLIPAQTGTNPVSGTFPVGAPSNGGYINNISPVMTFVIPDLGQKKTKSFEPAPLSESALEKMSMEDE